MMLQPWRQLPTSNCCHKRLQKRRIPIHKAVDRESLLQTLHSLSQPAYLLTLGQKIIHLQHWRCKWFFQGHCCQHNTASTLCCILTLSSSSSLSALSV